MQPLDERKIREEIRKKLEDEYTKKQTHPGKINENEISREELLLREKIRKEEEQKFYTQKGLVQYKNKFGEIEWLTPEEARIRKSRRKRKKKKISKAILKLRKNLLEGFILIVLLSMFFLVYKYYSGKRKIQPASAQIEINSNKAGVAIFLDGKFTNTYTPGLLPNLKPGYHSIFLEMPGYFSIPGFMQVHVGRNERKRFHFHLYPGLTTGEVVLNNLPAGTEIFADGHPVQLSHQNKVQLTEGWHAISVYHPQFEINPQAAWVHIDPEDIFELEFNSLVKDKLGKITITSSLNDLKIYINNKFVGLPPSLKPYYFKAGSYKINAYHPFYKFEPDEYIKQIDANKSYHLTISLAREQNRHRTSFHAPDYIYLFIDAFPVQHLMENGFVELVEGNHHLAFINKHNGKVTEQFITINGTTHNNFEYKATSGIFERQK